MWLACDERRLLAGYYRLIGDTGKEHVYEIDSLRPLLRRRPNYVAIHQYGDAASIATPLADPEDLKRGVAEYIADRNRIRTANRALSARGLIATRDHQATSSVILIQLTLEGYDLGRRYDHWWTWSGLLYKELKDHWLIVIVAFLAGILGSLVVEALK